MSLASLRRDTQDSPFKETGEKRPVRATAGERGR